MKKLLLPLLLMVIGISQKSVAATSAFNIRNAVDTVRKKLVHPKQAMADAEVKAILNTMRGKRNDEEKVVALKEAVKDKGITIDQLITLLNQFLTDDSKIECAEYAFPYTTNYKAFLDIMDIFSKQNYKDRLEDFYDKARKW
jgi:adenine specific DNA methylase Mod